MEPEAGTGLIRVVIVDDVPSTVDSLRKLLGFEPDMEVVGTAHDAEAGFIAVRDLAPDVVLMDVNMPGVDGIRATERMTKEPPYPPVVLMSVQDDREYLRRAMQAGAREFLVKPFSADDLAAALRRVHQSEQVRRAALVPEAPPEPEDEPRRPGQITVVFAGKGGVGKSLLALNLAAALSRADGVRVALVDLDLQFGDQGVMLGLESSRNIYQVVEAYPNIDADFVEALMPQAPGGFRVLLGPQSPEFADLVTAEHARAILDVLQGAFDHIVVDTTSHLGEVTLEALERADRIVVVVDLTLTAVKEAKLALRVFERLGLPADRIRVFLNRADVNAGITVSQLQSSLDVKIAGRMPSDPKTVLRSIHRAEPFVVLFPDSEISQGVREFATSLVTSPAAGGSRPGRGGRKLSFWARS